MQSVREETSEAQEEATSSGPLPVEALEAHGVGGADVRKLKEAGYHTVESVVYAPKKNLLAIKGISEAKADKLIVESQKLVPTGFTTATEIHMKRSQIIQVRMKYTWFAIHVPTNYFSQKYQLSINSFLL